MARKPHRPKGKNPPLQKVTALLDDDLIQWIKEESEAADDTMSKFIYRLLKKARRESTLKVIEGGQTRREGTNGGKA